MRRLSVFLNISLDGYFADAGNAMDWAHRQDAEWTQFAAGNASGDSTLLFGRVTYDMMAAFWPSDMAKQSMPDVARGMNRSEKIVFSRTLKHSDWANTRIVGSDLAGEVRALKAGDGPAIVILGSGSVVAQLTQAGLIDEYQFALMPDALGAGRTPFDGVTTRPTLKRTELRGFKNGAVFLRYETARTK
jgi:dihydrofolate reductase